MAWINISVYNHNHDKTRTSISEFVAGHFIKLLEQELRGVCCLDLFCNSTPVSLAGQPSL